MGKRIIVLGADFSANSLDSGLKEAALYQGYIYTNPSSQLYGELDLGTDGAVKPRTNMVKILIPAGFKAVVSMYNTIAKITTLQSSYVASANNVEMVDENVVSNISTYSHPVSTNYRDADGSFSVENTGATDLYYYICFAYDTSVGPDLPVADNTCYYELVELT
jgi:hypothetical protein